MSSSSEIPVLSAWTVSEVHPSGPVVARAELLSGVVELSASGSSL